ncbi:alkaline phosphatase PhoX [uncultured Modestobacter sp.]|uniref:alkaline phosphatase PhoX n=1 Tax=uncultured Modestobacter sp. TaxID=380048 RepID=UPI002628F814|nr:alkaline phosphatase PhoX [uncultured Modestobacter sp.]
MTTTHEQHPETNDAGVSRRGFLARSAATGLGVALVGSVESLFGAGSASAAPAGAAGVTGYGPLVPDPKGILALPRGFSYKIIAESGVTRLESGQFTPADPDGTASFPRRPGTGSVLVVNHEVSGSEENPVPAIPDFTYDPMGGGGTTNLEVDKDNNRIREYVSIAGTHNNCAGGVTPWDTWLTCEETEARVGSRGAYGTLTKDHGYVFEVHPYDQAENMNPQPLKMLGRFAHEAVVVDPRADQLYLTEDASNPNGLLYRWTAPRIPGGLRRAGDLKKFGPTDGAFEAMRAMDGGTHVPDLSLATEAGTTYSIEWVTVPDRDARTLSTRKQAYAKPITRSRKLEGMWWGDNGVYFVSSFAREGDSAIPHDGQVWFLDPRKETIELKLRFVYTPGDQDNDPDGPDNITVSPFGGVMIAEDGSGAQHLVGTTTSNEPFFFARNEASGSEFTGPNFAHDRQTMFANIQGDGSGGEGTSGPDEGSDPNPGYVFAITGPFRKIR